MTRVPGRRALGSVALAALTTFAVVATPAFSSAAAAAPAPAPASDLPSTQTRVKGEQAKRLAKAIEKRAADPAAKARTGKATTVTSPPTVVTLEPNDSGIGFLVFANGNGSLVWRYWSNTEGWTAWIAEGGNITGQPTYGVDAATGNLSYFATSQGRVVRSTTPSSWQDFGIATKADPVTLNNPGNGNLQVYAVATNGALHERYQTPAGAWSSWGSQGGNVTTGNVAPYFNPINNNVQLYINTGNALAERWWNSKNGRWSNWNTFAGGTITSAPVAFFNPNNRNTEIYANRDGDIVEIYWDASNGAWSGWGNFGGDATGAPAVFYNDHNQNVELYANSGGAVREKYWVAANGQWIGWNSFGGQTVGSPTVTLNLYTGRVHIISLGTDGQLKENSWFPEEPWTGWHTLEG